MGNTLSLEAPSGDAGGDAARTTLKIVTQQSLFLGELEKVGSKRLDLIDESFGLQARETKELRKQVHETREEMALLKAEVAHLNANMTRLLGHLDRMVTERRVMLMGFLDGAQPVPQPPAAQVEAREEPEAVLGEASDPPEASAFPEVPQQSSGRRFRPRQASGDARREGGEGLGVAGDGRIRCTGNGRL